MLLRERVISSRKTKPHRYASTLVCLCSIPTLQLMSIVLRCKSEHLDFPLITPYSHLITQGIKGEVIFILYEPLNITVSQLLVQTTFISTTLPFPHAVPVSLASSLFLCLECSSARCLLHLDFGIIKENTAQPGPGRGNTLFTQKKDRARSA